MQFTAALFQSIVLEPQKSGWEFPHWVWDRTNDSNNRWGTMRIYLSYINLIGLRKHPGNPEVHFGVCLGGSQRCYAPGMYSRSASQHPSTKQLCSTMIPLPGTTNSIPWNHVKVKSLLFLSHCFQVSCLSNRKAYSRRNQVVKTMWERER